jgi:hypothetical protein
MTPRAAIVCTIGQIVTVRIVQRHFIGYTPHPPSEGPQAYSWSNGRRGFFEALTAEPTGVAEALEQINTLHAIEVQSRDQKLVGAAWQHRRSTYSKPLVELFFEWVERHLQHQGFTRTNPFIQALSK